MSAENWPAPGDRPNWRYYEEPQRRLSWWVWVVLVVLAMIAAGVIYYFLQDHEPGLTRAPAAPPPSAQSAAQAQKPEIRHPVPRVEGETEKPLPPLDQSDEPLGERLAALLGNKAFDDFINPRDLVRRLVVTVDNLPRKTVPMRMRAVKPVPGQFASGAQNAARYDEQVKLFASLDARTLVQTYVRFYPLFQSTYSELGQPDAYFNDRVVAAIDDMLAAPDLKVAPQLVQPKVLFQYDDADLESRSAGQKILMRMGPANAEKVKAKLSEIRSQLTSTGLSGNPTPR